MESDNSALVLASRPQEVLNQINILKNNMFSNIIDMAELLSEVRRNKYNLEYGYSSFKDWIDNSGLDLSERSAYYLINVYDRSLELGIDKERLKRTKISKLKEIFSLKNATPAELRKLVDKSEDLSLKQIQDEVRIIRYEGKEDTYSFITLKVADADWKAYIEPAINTVRAEAGSNYDSTTGDPLDISYTQAIVLICQDYLADPNRQVLDMPLTRPNDVIEVVSE
jgi:hypothetical protein